MVVVGAVACGGGSTTAPLDAASVDAGAIDATPGPTPLGHQLFRGRGARRLSQLGLPTEINFFVASSDAAASGDLYVALLDGVTQAPLFRGVSMKHLYTVNLTDVWLVHDVRQVDVGGARRNAGTLARVSREGVVLEEIPNVVTSFYSSRARPVRFERPSADGNVVELVVRNEEWERALPGARFIRANGRGLDYLAPDRRLLRIDDAGVERILRAGVVDVSHASGATYLLELADDEGGGYAWFDPATAEERRLPGADVSGMINLTLSSAFYGERRTDAHPARVHRYDMDRGEDQVWDAPTLTAVTRAERIPDSDAYLLLDGEGGAALWRSGTAGTVRPITGAVFDARASYDGRYVLWFDDASDGARLVVGDSAFERAPVVVSPPGAVVPRPRDGVAVRTTVLGFSGRTNLHPASHLFFTAFTDERRDAVTLYAWELAAGKLEVVETDCIAAYPQIGSTLAIVGAAPGSGRGSFVFRDRDRGTTTMIAADVVQGGLLFGAGRLVYVVEGAVPGPHDGVWTLPVDERGAPM